MELPEVGGEVKNPQPTIDTEKFSAQLRSRGIRPETREILLTRFSGSEQEKDFTLPTNCEGFGRIHHFRRAQDKPWPDNPLPIDPAIRALQLQRSDEIQVQVFQNAICSWRCWYCFVDYKLLSADRRFSEFKSADELLDLYLEESPRPPVIDLSGGQPDLVPEWSLWVLEALERRRLDRSIYVWSDDNLSNDYLWRFLSEEQIRHLAESPNYGRVGCFKGFDSASFSFNTNAEPALFEQQFKLMRMLVDIGFDVYGYTTFTCTTDQNLQQLMIDFVDRLQELVHPIFPLRTIPLKVSNFTPTSLRLEGVHRRAFELQKVAVIAWNEEIRKRFTPDEIARDITEHILREREIKSNSI